MALAVVAGAALVARGASAQECAAPKAEWLFCDDFESAQDQNGNLGLWDDQGLRSANLVLTTNAANVHGGARSLEITSHKGADTGGGPSKWFLPGADVVHLRFWVRFASNYNYAHHLVFLGANQASDRWSAFGTAGCRPNGQNFFTTQVEAFSDNGRHRPPGAWGFYSYSNDMQCDPGANCQNYANPQQICNDCAMRGSPCTNGLECCWGTNNITSPPMISALGAWSCLEVRVQANTGSQANGRQTLWFNGQQAGEWANIRFRTNDALKINALGLWHYVTDDSYAAGQTQQTIWFDDVIVSSGPIGCGGNVTDGGIGTGGSGGAAGAAGAAGSAGSAGNPASGGSAGTGGSGGAAPGTGGAAGAGASAGSSSAGRGSGGTTSAGTAGRSSAAPAESDSSCACRLAGSPKRGELFALLGGLFALFLSSGLRFPAKKLARRNLSRDGERSGIRRVTR